MSAQKARPRPRPLLRARLLLLSPSMSGTLHAQRKTERAKLRDRQSCPPQSRKMEGQHTHARFYSECQWDAAPETSESKQQPALTQLGFCFDSIRCSIQLTFPLTCLRISI